jgi:hypothetical protein
MTIDYCAPCLFGLEGLLSDELRRLEMQNVRDFEEFLDIYLPDIKNSDVILVTAYINDNICERARVLKSQGNLVKIIVLRSLAEIGALPGDIDMMALAGEEGK